MGKPPLGPSNKNIESPVMENNLLDQEKKISIIRPHQNNLFDLSSPPMEIMDTVKKETVLPEKLASTLPPKKINQDLKQIISLYGEKKFDLENNKDNNIRDNFPENRTNNVYNLNLTQESNNKMKEEKINQNIREKQNFSHNYLINNKSNNSFEKENFENKNLSTPLLKIKQKRYSVGEELSLNAVKDLNIDGFLESWQAPPIPIQVPSENNHPAMLYYQASNKLIK